jgi:F-type H+-transporting ATPase subunit delta
VLDDPEVARVFAGPQARDRKRELLARLAESAGGPPELRNFLLLVADHDRIGHVGAIRAVFDQLVDRSRGITRARVRTAAPLNDTTVEQLKRVFGERTGKEVVPQIAVEPELVAGVIVEVDGKVYDGSLRTQLAKLHRQMASGG